MTSKFSRRQILSIISFSLVGTAVVSSVPSLKNFFISKAQAQEIADEVYKGRKYKIIKNPNAALRRNGVIDNTFDVSTQLFVDNKEVRILQNKKNKKYVTPLLFGEYDNPKEIAKSVIDLNLKFPEKEVQIDPTID